MREIYKGLREIFGEKGAGMGVGDPIYAPTAPCRCAGAVSARGCSFFATRQRTNQENVQGALPLDPAPPRAAQLFAPSVGNFVSQGGAQR